MFLKMWRTFLLSIWWSANSFCYSLNISDNDQSSDLTLNGRITLDTNEEMLEIERLYFSKIPGPEVSTDYSNEYKPGDDKKYASFEELPGIDENSAFQPWSILWYVGSFGGLIAFFLVVSCSEWCCRNRRRETVLTSGTSSPAPSEVPPPAYDLFGPPSYESLCRNSEKFDYDVFVVPVHSISSLTDSTLMNDAETIPPAYSTSQNDTASQTVINISPPEEQRPKTTGR